MSSENVEYIYCTECSTNVKHIDGEPACQQCNPDFNMSCTQELDFNDPPCNPWGDPVYE